MMKTGLVLAWFLLMVPAGWAADTNPPGSGGPAGGKSELGLTVSAEGHVLLRGRPFRGIGVNYYDAFVRALQPGAARDVGPGFRALADHGIPFARFSAGGYWPADWGLYRTNRAAHWQRLDAVVRVAEQTGVGLIPSLFWHPPTLADLAGEPMDQWGQATSKTIAFMRDYTRQVVTRYQDSPAVWAWEFGNEFNLGADLPNAAQHRPPVHPGLGTPSSRSTNDELTHAAFRVALAEFAREVRRHDSNRLILSGNAFPRPSAWHQMREKSWARDSEAQWSEMMSGDNPEPMRSLSARLYTSDDMALLPWAAAVSSSSQRPLFVGELGVPGPLTVESLARFRAWLDALEAHDVPLAALWVFDFDGQRDDWNVTFDNARAPLLKLVAERQAAWNRMAAVDGPLPEVRFPASPFVVDVTQAPYSAKGDGVSDDTEALQRAINEHTGQARVLYFPTGTYLVSRTLTWPKKWKGRDNWGKTMLRGQHRDRCVIRLKDGVFADPKKPQAIMWCGGFGSADWFHNYVEGLTFDVGSGNPGAVALQFYSNNSGAVRDCRFVAPEGSGWIGLDLAHRDMNGPLLVRNCEVTGFRRGIATGHAVNSQTFEHITLRGQTEFGFDNTGQTLSIRNLSSDNAVPALRSYGTVCLVDAKLTGRPGAERFPAVVNYNGGRMMLRDVATSGYGRALGDVATPDFTAAYRLQGENKPGSLGPNVREYFFQPPLRPFPGPAQGSLRLPVLETPDAPVDEVTTWANVDAFGADPEGKKDSSPAIQQAMDSGATTVFLPGSYNLRSTVVIRGKVRRIVGLGGSINYGEGIQPDLRLVDGDAPVVWIEHVGHVDGGLEVDTRRTLVMRSVSDCDLRFTPKAEGGELCFEDVVTHDLKLRRQRLWARQLNVENEGTHLVNDGGDLWVLGYKTERGGTLLDTRGGGRSEILGNFSYTTTAGKLAPMFVNEAASVFAFFGEVCFNGDPFQVWVREVRGGETREVRKGEGMTLPYLGIPGGP